jgi:transforming growth factor-beta-induced protein
VYLDLIRLRPATVFVPNNTAFQALGSPYNTLAGLKTLTTAQLATLKNIISYHVVPQRAYSPNLKNENISTLLTGKTVGVDVSNGIKLTGLAANNTANVVTTNAKLFNITASNGVIHQIDKVLLPQ